MALNGQKASFLAGGEFPVPIVQGGQNVGVVTIQFRPFGVRLEFTGHIGKDNVIRLHVAPEVSTLDFSNAAIISGFTVPALSTRRAETEIELKNGQSFGIAGLLDNRAQAQLSKVPGIGDIPILGLLFRSKSISRSNSELVVLVTPHIVDPAYNETNAAAGPTPSSHISKIPSSTIRCRVPRKRRTCDINEFGMREMTTKAPYRLPRESLPTGDPLSVVGVCLDPGTWGTVKMFSGSAPLVRLDRHLSEYRVEDQSVLSGLELPRLKFA